MTNHLDCSIIVLSYNTKTLLKQCLQAILKAVKNTNFRIEIIVVDNASKDDSVQMIKEEFRSIHLVELKKNIGFSKGNNQGIKMSHGKFILLINSDVLIQPDTLETMLRFMKDHDDVGVATCKLVFTDGNLDPACHRGFPTPWAAFTYFSGLEKLFPHNCLFSKYHLGYKSLDLTHDIDSPSGAFYLVRREVIKDVGLLDEDYFMYGEDLDWSYRIRQAGWRIMYVPLTQAIHLKKQSGRKSKNIKSKKKSTSAFYDTMKIFYRKHYTKKYPKPIQYAVFVAVDILKSLLIRHNKNIQ